MLAPFKEMSLYGDRKYPIPCVSAFIRNDQGQVLLTKRSQKVFFPGAWCLPGGHVDGGQEWVQTLCAEVKEEVGLNVLEHRLVGIYSDPNVNQMFEPQTQTLRTYVNVLFLVSRFEGHVTPNDEVSEVGWYSEKELPTPFLECERIKTLDGFHFNGTVFVK